MTEIVLDGESLTFEHVLSVAYGGPGKRRVVIADDATTKVNRASAAVDTLLDRGEVAYGITTGFGAFKDKIISREEVEQLQKNIVLSHAVGVGDPFDVPTTRAIMMIRAPIGISARIPWLADFPGYGSRRLSSFWNV